MYFYEVKIIKYSFQCGKSTIWTVPYNVFCLELLLIICNTRRLFSSCPKHSDNNSDNPAENYKLNVLKFRVLFGFEDSIKYLILIGKQCLIKSSSVSMAHPFNTWKKTDNQRIGELELRMALTSEELKKSLATYKKNHVNFTNNTWIIQMNSKAQDINILKAQDIKIRWNVAWSLYFRPYAYTLKIRTSICEKRNLRFLRMTTFENTEKVCGKNCVINLWFH